MNPKTQWKRDKRLSWFGEKDRMEGIIEALGDAMRHFYRHYSGKASVKNDWKNSPLYIPLGKYTKDKHNKWYKINHLTWRVDNPEHGIRRFLTPKMVRKGLFFPALRITWMLLGAGVFTEGVGIIQESADILECLYNKDMILAKDAFGEVHAATEKVITKKKQLGGKFTPRLGQCTVHATKMLIKQYFRKTVFSIYKDCIRRPIHPKLRWRMRRPVP